MTAPILVTRSTKSVGIAILLTFLFGPIGLFYASVSGGLIMTFAPILLFLLFLDGLFQQDFLLVAWSAGLLIVFSSTFWLISIIWAAISVRSHNQEIEENARLQLEIWNRYHNGTPNHVVVNINSQNASEASTFGRKEVVVSAKPGISEWLKHNPGKTINDYFALFGKDD